jgi:hypothetical protein
MAGGPGKSKKEAVGTFGEGRTPTADNDHDHDNDHGSARLDA